MAGICLSAVLAVSIINPISAEAAVAPVGVFGSGQAVNRSITFSGTTYNATPDYNMAWQVLDLVNSERAKAGLPALTMDQKLLDTAMGRAAEISVKFAHTRPNGSDCFSAYPSGLGYCGENIAAGYASTTAVMNGWMNSSGHRSNILSSGFKSIGIGCVKTGSGYGIYWTQCFGDRVLQAAVRPGSGSVSYVSGGVDYSAVFDADYYLNKYGDLKKAFGTDKVKAFTHFMNYGMKEGRQGKATFNFAVYKANYADLRNAFGSNNAAYYKHYVQYGKKEGRNATTYISGASKGSSTPSGGSNASAVYGGVNYAPVFNASYYSNKYPDLKRAFGSDSAKLLKHFVDYGMKEGRQASASFDVNIYKNNYADLQRAFGSNLKQYYMHYINYGKREGRDAVNFKPIYNGVNYSAVFDANYYLGKYPDLKKAFGTDKVKAFNHFTKYGMREGRQGKATFNLSLYKNRYADLRKAFGNDNARYYEHFVKYGQKEGRKAN